MTTQTPNDIRPVWLVSGGPQWRYFTKFWQHYDIEHDHTNQIREMQPGDWIALRTDALDEAPLKNEHGEPVASVGIWATGKVERTEGHFVYVDWNLDHLGGARLRNCRVDGIATHFAENRCIWEVDPRDEAQRDFIREVFGEDELDDESDRSISDIRPDPYHVSDGLPIEQRITNFVTDGCFLDQAKLEAILRRLRTKQNIILQGPPGTGKTWLAKRLAYALIGQKDDNKVRSFQFHPNMSYEDFVRGWRPQGGGKLELVDGPFPKLCDDARNDLGGKYVIVIEEINRGNPASTFGELLTLLEADKRDESEALALAYPREPCERFYIPPNVYVIGTMNTADRSIAMIDLALRRRFAFFDLEPVFSDVWRDWVHQNCGIPGDFLTDIAQRIASLNDQIADDRNLGRQFRIGHSHVTPPPGTAVDDPASWFREIVETEIAPLLYEYWFDDPSTADDAKDALLANLQ